MQDLLLAAAKHISILCARPLILATFDGIKFNHAKMHYLKDLG